MLTKQSPFTIVTKALLLSIWLVITLFPLYWILITSFKAPGAIAAFPLQYLPRVWTMENYVTLFTNFDSGSTS